METNQLNSQGLNPTIRASTRISILGLFCVSLCEMNEIMCQPPAYKGVEILQQQVESCREKSVTVWMRSSQLTGAWGIKLLALPPTDHCQGEGSISHLESSFQGAFMYKPHLSQVQQYATRWTGQWLLWHTFTSQQCEGLRTCWSSVVGHYLREKPLVFQTLNCRNTDPVLQGCLQ